MIKKNKFLKKSKKGILINETVGIIITLLSIFILILIGVGFVVNFFSQENVKAENTINLISNVFSEGELKTDKILIESPKDWYIVSFENNKKEVCKSDFCICVCKRKDCKSEKSCKETENLFLIKNDKGVIIRSIQIKKPFEFQISFLEEKVYPFDSSDVYVGDMNLYSLGKLGLETKIIFFRFNNTSKNVSNFEINKDFFLEFSIDLIDWKKLTGNKGFTDDFSDYLKLRLSQKEKNETFLEDYYLFGKEFLKDKGIIESEGVFILNEKS